MRPALSIFSFKRVVSVALLLALVLSGVAFWSNALRMNDGYYKNTPLSGRTGSTMCCFSAPAMW